MVRKVAAKAILEAINKASLAVRLGVPWLTCHCRTPVISVTERKTALRHQHEQ
jgi:hypothetical protein